MDMIVNSQFIIEQRKSKAWSQQHLADVSGLSLRTVQRIENTGSGAPDSIKAIAMAFGLIPADLMMNSINESQSADVESDNHRTQTPGLWSRQLLSTAAGLIAVCLFGTTIWLTAGSNSSSNALENSSENAVSTEQSEAVSAEQAILERAVLSGLALIDAGDYQASWQESDSVVQGQVSSEQWQKTVAPVRTPLGSVTARTLSSLQFHSGMQGLPDGEYAIVVYSTHFVHKVSSYETIPMSKASGKWKPIGYFIR